MCQLRLGFVRLWREFSDRAHRNPATDEKKITDKNVLFKPSGRRARSDQPVTASIYVYARSGHEKRFCFFVIFYYFFFFYSFSAVREQLTFILSESNENRSSRAFSVHVYRRHRLTVSIRTAAPSPCRREDLFDVRGPSRLTGRVGKTVKTFRPLGLNKKKYRPLIRRLPGLTATRTRRCVRSPPTPTHGDGRRFASVRRIVGDSVGYRGD